MFGLSSKANSVWLHVANFLIVFGTQIAFKFDDIINTGVLPTEFEFIKIFSNSLVITIIFYGGSKLISRKEPEK